MRELAVQDGVFIAASELTWTAVRSSGAGGQNVNKVSSKVELCFDAARSRSLSPAVKQRLFALCKHRLDAQGRIRIVSQVTRDQPKNLEDARERLAALVRAALTPPKPRHATKPTRASKRRRVEAKQHTSHKKRLRRRVDDE
jgi:ribosome-associated protein